MNKQDIELIDLIYKSITKKDFYVNKCEELIDKKDLNMSDLNNMPLNDFVNDIYIFIFGRFPTLREKFITKIQLSKISRTKFLCDLLHNSGTNKIIEDLVCFEYKNSFKLDDFLVYDNDEFIENSYLGLLKRMPDLGGKSYYLEQLNTNKMTKEEIILNISESEEAKKIGMKISK